MLKEQVKNEKLTAKSALSRLLVKADLNKETNVMKQSKTYNWLTKKLKNELAKEKK